MISGTQLAIASVASETGALLKSYLIDRGVYNPNSKAITSYGCPRTGFRYVLNGGCGTGKIDRLQAMQDAGVRTIPWFTGGTWMGDITYPLLARKSHGYGGTDIVPVFQPEEIPWRVQAGWDWFSEYIPIEREFRVWIFRGEHLDTYEKIMKRPGDYTRIGRNFGNGFDFQRTNPVEAATDMAIRAVASGLDFGAVDLILGKDHQVYVLECNTAPGVIQSGAQGTLAKLADCIADWARGGYKERGL